MELKNPSSKQKYLSKWLEALPENTVINKGLTGCGATTLAIQQERDTIIAVPFIPLIVNKTEKHADVLLGLYGEGDFRPEIANYLTDHDRIKIMATYDAIPKLCNALRYFGYDPYKRIHLVIDEWHLLMMSYGFRGDTIRSLLNEAKQFQNVTYISATPIERQYWFPEMQGLREWTIKWPNAKNVQVNKVKTATPVKTAAAMCMNRIKYATGPNYHLFMNSVKGIVEIIRKAGLTSENASVVCADNQGNRNKLPEGFKISKPGDPVKTINFYTSTCFEGCDLFDENGRSFIICDPNRPNTLLDISTSMLQIAGRIRDSRYRGELTLIYNTTRYEDEDSLDLYMKRIEREVAEAKEDAAWLNDGPDTRFRRQLLLELKQFDAPFIRWDNNEIVIDQNMIHLDIINYKVIHGIYNLPINLDNELARNNIKVKGNYYADARYVEVMSLPRLSFKDCCERYAEIKPDPGTYSLVEDEEITRLKEICPEACEAVDKLGIDEVRRMRYHKGNIHRKVVSLCGTAQDVKIKKELDQRLSKFQPYTIPEIKKVLGEIYEDVNLEKKPVATDLIRWYRIRQTKKDGHDAYVIEGDALIIL